MSEKFIPRAKAIAIRRALRKMIMEQVQRVPEQWADELLAAAQAGGVAAVRAVLEAKCDELSAGVDDLVAAAIEELDRAAK
jgi:hypothetical protein